MDYRVLANRLLTGAAIASALAGISALSKSLTETLELYKQDRQPPAANTPLPELSELGTAASASADRLAQIIRQPSSGQSVRKSGIGPIKDIHKLIEQNYPNLHKVAERTVISKRNLLLLWPSPDTDPIGAPVAILTAMDVVEPGDLGWRYPAYSGTITDGKVFGPGAAGTKGALVVWLEALEALASSGYAPARNIALVVSTDGTWTETDGIAPTRLRQSLRSAISPWLTIDSRNTLPSGAKISNFEHGKAVYRVTASSANALKVLTTALARIDRMHGPRAITTKTTVTAVSTDGSGVMNPDQASAILLADIGAGDSPGKLYARIRRAISDRRVQLDTLGAYDPAQLDADPAVAHSIANILTAATPLAQEEPQSLALGDQEYSEIRCSPLLPTPDEQPWAPNEHVSINSLRAGVARARNLIVAATNHGRPQA